MILTNLVETGAVSAVTALAGTADEILWTGSAGDARAGQPAGPETIYDFASITKLFVATLALVLDAQGRLPLGKHDEDLLRHRSRRIGWTPLYHLCRSRQDVLALLDRLPAAPSGTYSDLGYIQWGLAAEDSLGEPLSRLLQREVLDPLDLSGVAVAPGDRPGVAESRMGTGQEIRLAAGQGLSIPDLGPPGVGEPQDGNARFLLANGWSLPGHSGLFGRAADLWKLGAEWLRPGKLLAPQAVARALGGGGPFALGWWRRRARSGGGGAALGRRAVGSTGFAGGNLWIDPESGRIYVLLAHRIDPLADFNVWRRRFHSEVSRALV